MRTLTRDQVRRLDALAIEDLGIPGVVLMENAGRGAAEFILDLLDLRAPTRVVVLCGAGNNGGDGFVIARYLMLGGHYVVVAKAVAEDAIRGDALVNYRVLRNMGISVPTIRKRGGVLVPAIGPEDVVVDALLGTGFQGRVRTRLARIITAINSAKKGLTVSVDVPSGLDCDTGQPGGVAVRADHTLTFVAPKVGFSRPGALQWTGQIRVVGIGTPHFLIEQVLRESHK